ncbi:MAG: hypothetical protein ACUVT2_11285, partial [Thiobacillaceae bacterium]
VKRTECLQKSKPPGLKRPKHPLIGHLALVFGEVFNLACLLRATCLEYGLQPFPRPQGQSGLNDQRPFPGCMGLDQGAGDAQGI